MTTEMMQIAHVDCHFCEDRRTIATWIYLHDGCVLRWTFTLGGPLGQDQRLHIIEGA